MCCNCLNIDNQLEVYKQKAKVIWCLHWVMILILALLPIVRIACYISSFSYEHVQPLGYDQIFTYSESLIEDWRRVLIVDIQLVGPDGQCEDPAFNRYWPGTESYSLGLNEDQKKKIEVEGLPGVDITSVDGVTICLGRSTKAYEDMNLIDQETGECRAGEERCSSYTSDDNTICVPIG